DPYMQAVARTLESLAERLTADSGLTRSELVEALDTLALHTEAATGYVPRSLRQQIAEVLDTLARDVESPTTQIAEADAPPAGELDDPGAPPPGSGEQGDGEAGA